MKYTISKNIKLVDRSGKCLDVNIVWEAIPRRIILTNHFTIQWIVNIIPKPVMTKEQIDNFSVFTN